MEHIVEHVCVCLLPRDSVEANVCQSTPLYLSDTVDQDGRDSRDGVGAE